MCHSRSWYHPVMEKTAGGQQLGVLEDHQFARWRHSNCEEAQPLAQKGSLPKLIGDCCCHFPANFRRRIDLGYTLQNATRGEAASPASSFESQ